MPGTAGIVPSRNAAREAAFLHGFPGGSDGGISARGRGFSDTARARGNAAPAAGTQQTSTRPRVMRV
ncbi:hypothetical protein SALB1_1035 [Salinisphaera sp. LB1]|nr:hypothetical protein SALB1_1035 [Salinisphaera sp. LB1]